jgi:hypothetical protein
LPIHKFPIRPEFIELLLGLMAGSVAYAISRTHSSWIERWGIAVRRTARRRALWIAVAALLGPGIRLALIPVAPLPYPEVHDEFVHLLGADTLLHGRLANPPLPFSDHFETIYVIQKPAYASSYPLGLSMFLAAGWELTGQPWFGVWLAMVLCCGSIAWMLYRWVPPPAAMIGGLLCSIFLGLPSFWMNTYYGAAPAAAGGALVFGGLPPLIRTARLKYAGIVAAGWTLIWFTRPYESVIVGLIIALAALSSLRKLRAGVALIAIAVALDAGAFAYCNWRVTGEPLLTPYQLTQKIQGVPHAFIWQTEIPEPPNLTPQQERMYLYQREYYRESRSLTRRWLPLWNDVKKIWAMDIGYPLTIPFLLSLFAKGRKARTLRIILGVCLAWSLLYPRILPNYTAAITAVFFAMSARGLLMLFRWRRPLGACLVLAFCFGTALTGLRVLHGWYLYGAPTIPTQRMLAAERLDTLPRSQLVFVRYGPDHEVHDEWVYNRADIPSAKIVWANDLGEERNHELIRYLGDRQVWLAQPDQSPVLTPYDSDGIHTR